MRRSVITALVCGLVISSGLFAQDNSAPAATTEVSAPHTQSMGNLTVVVDGIAGALRENVLAALALQRLSGQPAPEEARLRWLHDQAASQIRAALQPFGYYTPTITATLDHTLEGWCATYHIAQGRALPVAALSVHVMGEGETDTAFQALTDHLPMSTGQPLVHAQYEQIKQTLETLATERGYFDARFTESTIRIDLEAYDARITVRYDTGKRYRFGPITFAQTVLSQKRLKRYLHFKEGDPYHTNDLLKLQSDLNSSPYFQHVQVNAPPDATTRTAPVHVDLEANVLHKHSISVGYGTDTGVRTRLRTEQHWVNPQGHHYEAELQASAITSQLGIKYLIPGLDPTTDEYALSAHYAQQDDNQQAYQRSTLGGSWQQQYGLLLKRYGLSYQYEDFRIGHQPTAHSLLLIPSAQWVWITADDRIAPHRGLSLDLEVCGATQSLLSDLDFVQSTLHLKGVYALNETSRLIARSDVGATAIRQPFAELPSSLRFLAGGDTNVRGYAYNSIGPINAEGVVIGGKNLLVGSLEYEHRLWDGWSAAAFVDSGDAFDGVAPDFKTGAGVGLRWRSPVGPVRLDLATGFDRPPGDTFRFSIGIGPDL